jgi:hypothetical protein
MKKEELVDKLAQQLRAVKDERAAARREPALLAARRALKHYQSQRLAATHADLLGAPDSHDAAMFFLQELYGAHDLSQRDVDLERVIPTMQRVLSYESLHAITEAIVLDALSERLDTTMARALGPDFSQQQYVEAYRTLTDRAERERQLALVHELGNSLCKLVRTPLLSLTLSAMRTPARLAGLGQMQQFLERGFNSFRQVKKPRALVDTVVARERRVLANIYAGRGQPFDVGAGA